MVSRAGEVAEKVAVDEDKRQQKKKSIKVTVEVAGVAATIPAAAGGQS